LGYGEINIYSIITFKEPHLKLFSEETTVWFHKKKGALFTGKAHFGLAPDKYAPVLGGRCHLLKQLQSTHAN
jgi:hypothetical protein